MDTIETGLRSSAQLAEVREVAEHIIQKSAECRRIWNELIRLEMRMDELMTQHELQRFQYHGVTFAYRSRYGRHQHLEINNSPLGIIP